MRDGLILEVWPEAERPCRAAKAPRSDLKKPRRSETERRGYFVNSGLK
jgi:hypothetical protein